MATFNYTAMAKDGRKLEGTVEAGDRRNAMMAVEKLGYRPISVVETKAAKIKQKSASIWKLKIGNAKPRMKSVEVLLFTSELADLIES